MSRTNDRTELPGPSLKESSPVDFKDLPPLDLITNTWAGDPWRRRRKEKAHQGRQLSIAVCVLFGISLQLGIAAGSFTVTGKLYTSWGRVFVACLYRCILGPCGIDHENNQIATPWSPRLYTTP